MAIASRCYRVLLLTCSLCAIIWLFIFAIEEKRKTTSEYLLVNSLKAPDDLQWTTNMESELPQVPFGFWLESHGPYSGKYKDSLAAGGNCSVPFPSPMHLDYHNTYWQTHNKGQIIYRLYGAYYDRRVEPPVVRVLAMLSAPAGPHPLSYCQLWYRSSESSTMAHITAVNNTLLLWKWQRKANYLYPVMLECPVPTLDNGALPQAISIAPERCSTTSNVLRVWHSQPAPPVEPIKEYFAICVKGLDYLKTNSQDVVRLVEWLELQRLLGAHKIIIYDYKHSAELSRVLDYYVAQDFVELRGVSLSGALPRLPHMEHYLLQYFLDMGALHEMIHYNDCFYRHMHAYRYIAMLDLDEVFMPLGCTRSWQELLLRLPASQSECAICFRNVYFPTGEQPSIQNEKLYMLSHTRRLAKHSDPFEATKCFHDTRQVLAVHNHFPLMKLPAAQCRHDYILPTSLAHMQHYRYVANHRLAPLLDDRNIWRYADTLRQLTNFTLEKLKFI